MAWHALEVLDYDLTGEFGPWAPPPPFAGNPHWLLTRLPAPWTRTEMLGYLDYCRTRVRDTRASMTDEQAARPLPLVDTAGAVVGITAVAIDITERKRLLDIAQQARRDIETALAVRDEFLTVAAHELKNPLTSLLGSTDLLLRRALRDHALNEPETQIVKRIKHQAKRLGELVGTLLDITLLQTGALRVQPSALDVRSLVERLVDEVSDLIDDSYVVQFEGPPDVVLIRGDEARLEQVFHNLIANAVKYSPNGGTIRVRVDYDEAWVTVMVADQGIGIPDDVQARLFEKFYRGPNTSTSGLGIGLFVAKEILALHGGDITVASKVNEGSTFIVRLPSVPQAKDGVRDG